MKHLGPTTKWLLAAAIGLVSTSSEPTLAEDVVDFGRDVRPILANYCLECHGPDGQQRAADLRLDVASSVFQDRDGYRVVDREHPHQSEMLVRIRSDDADQRMPPPDAPTEGAPRRATFWGRCPSSGSPKWGWLWGPFAP